MPATAPLLRQLDHVVLAVHDLARASDHFRALGFTVTPGGRHPGRTSHNALVVFADGSYIEIIAWRAPAPKERWWCTLQLHGEGLVDHALLPAAVEPVLEAAHARGLSSLRGPVPGGRTRPDGQRVEWQSARHDSPDVPFLCADLTPRALRVPEGALRQHANGATGIARVSVAALDLARSRARWHALLGPDIALTPRPGNAELARVGYQLGETRFELVGRTHDAGVGMHAQNQHTLELARQRLARRHTEAAEGPFALQLHGPTAPEWLDPALCHGAGLLLGTAATH